MSTWYVANMSPATAPLALSLAGHLGLLAAPEEGPAPPGPLDVLETHCGDARAAQSLLASAERGGARPASYTACDFSEGMLSVARARLDGLASVVLADSTSLPFEDAKFDRYLSNMGCCCVSDLDAKLREARRVLRPGGVAAMSMRLEGGDGDTSFALISRVLNPFGFPPGADRDGLHLGKEPARLRARLVASGFSSAVAWRSWVTFPIHDAAAFLAFALGQPPVAKFLGGLEESRRQEAGAALEKAGREALEAGAIQVAVAVVVARV